MPLSARLSDRGFKPKSRTKIVIISSLSGLTLSALSGLLIANNAQANLSSKPPGRCVCTHAPGDERTVGTNLTPRQCSLFEFKQITCKLDGREI